MPLCFCFGRENVQIDAQRDVPGAQPAATSQSAGPPKKRRASTNPLYFSDFSRARIEEHYENSHPKQWALYKRELSERGRSAETNNAFFRREKITAHFARRDQ
jgi:hypothetical protein